MSAPQRFRKKPVEIEAMQWDGTAEGGAPIIEWVLASGGSATYWGPGERDLEAPNAAYLIVETLEGEMLGSPGDFIIRGFAREFYPCKPDIFAATYEAVSDD